MSFLIKNETFFKKYNEIWKKVNNIIKKEFNSEPVYVKKDLKTEKNQNKRILLMYFSISHID